MQKVRWGIISTAKIGMEKVTPALQQGEHCEVVAIASRSLDKAQDAASTLGIEKAYGSYEDLLADPNIDAVYNPLPNNYHVPVTLQALEAGKHVLCEKPIALSADEAQQLLDASKKYPHLKVMEAFMYRFHPQWRKTKELVDAGEIGTLTTIQTAFSFYNRDPNNVRNKPGVGGGGLMDIGCYCISLARLLFNQEPRKVMGSIEMDEEFGTDRIASSILTFENGSSSFVCSMQMSQFQRVNVFGTQGRIEIEIPFNAPPDKPARIFLQKGSEVTELTFEPVDQYTLQGDAFSLAILNDTLVPTPLEDAVNNMRVIDAVFESAEKNAWVTL